ncbi:hypothetical protein SEA_VALENTINIPUFF_12 [Microbacterium phage ValentiniPuff]|uniref:Uncharacterized protein n=1 Tax=Microbacterium phage ValentiniPuff TaxID=2315705 RepID=A0A386KPF7_9CAUD|nr:hypothetical protein SEA_VALENTINIPUFF_12 [Microbacterium phage ValentiniPuff]
MNDIIETHPLTPTARIAIRVDQDAEVPRGGDWDTPVGFAKVDGLGDSRRTDPPAAHEPPIPLERMFNALRWRRGGTPPFTDLLYKRHRDSVEQTVRWARIFTGGLEVVWDDEHGGFWFCHFGPDESADRTHQLESIKAARDLYETWAEGGVYEVTLQRLQTYVRVQNADADTDNVSDVVDWNDQIEQWEDVPMQALAGCYLDEEYPAEQVALDHFALSEAEAAAAKALIAEADRNLAGAASPLASE